ATEERDTTAPALRTVFHRQGWYVNEAGEKIARHSTRLIFSADSPTVKIEHRLIVTDNGEKRWFKEYGLRLSYAKAAQPDEVFFPESEKADAASVEAKLSESVREAFLFQEKAFYMSRMDPVKDCHFLIGEVAADGGVRTVQEGSLAGNWILAGNKQYGVGMALRNFWQTFPKELNSTHEAMTLYLWSSRGGTELDLRTDSQRKNWPEEWYNENYASKPLMARINRMKLNAVGMARSHDFVITLSSTPDPKAMAQLGSQTQTPPVSLVAPSWLRFTEAMGRFAPYDPARFPEEEAFVEEWFRQYTEIWRQWGDYGFMEFGNWPHVWFNKAKDGPLEGRWIAYVDRYSSALDYGTYAHLWRTFARSGQRKYFDAAEETTRKSLDLNMANWDNLTPEDVANFESPKRLPTLLKGTYTSSNSPFSWGFRSCLHNNSATDLRALAYWYYLTDYRPAMEMLENYHEIVKKLWDAGYTGTFKSSRPFAILKNLATVYQETGDPEMRPIIEEQLKFLVDLEAPQGVNRDAEATKLAKYGVKASAIQRTYEILKSPLAAKSLIRGASTWSKNSLGHLPMRYYEAEGELLATAYDLTKDPAFLRDLRRDMALTLSAYRSEDDKGWKRMWDGVGPSASSNVYPLGGIAFAMDAIARYEDETGQKVELTPFARQSGFGNKILIAVEKPENKEITLDLRSLHELNPIIYNEQGTAVEGVKKTAYKDQFHSLYKAATQWTIILPAKLPAGSYFIDSGVGGNMWELTWTNAPSAVIYSPDAYLIGSRIGLQWGNRVMTSDPDHEATVYFLVPEKTSQFEISAGRGAELIRPDGKKISVEGGGSVQSISVDEAEQGKVWGLRTPDITFVKLQGVPPFFAYGDPERFFVPNAPKSVLEKLLPASKAPLKMPNPKDKLYAAFDSKPGEPQHGIILTGKRRLDIPNADLISTESGTMEFWIMPYWNSTDQLGIPGEAHTLLDADTWGLVFHRWGEMSVTALVKGSNANSNNKKPPKKVSIESNAGAILEHGHWSHVAMQWKKDQQNFVLELYVNGRKQGFGRFDAGMPARVEDFSPAQAAAELIFGTAKANRFALNAILGGLRFSELPRYTKDFDPRAAHTLEADAKTKALFLFDGNADATGGSNKAVTHGNVLNP
ncbi:MAG: hypothetical protein ACK5LK_10640, partial [Chthoniobacterales bacterium]